MSEKETRFKELKKILRPFNILGIVHVVVIIIAAVFIIVDLCIRNETTNILFWVGIGSAATVIIYHVATVVVRRKELNEITKLRKEIRKQITK